MPITSKALLFWIGISVPSIASAAMIEKTPVDFVVDWPSLIGETVRITGGRVFGADSTRALLMLGSDSVVLDPPWKDREDLRHVLTHCTALDSDPAFCGMPVTGVVAAYKDALDQEQVKLEGVDFEIPTAR